MSSMTHDARDGKYFYKRDVLAVPSSVGLLRDLAGVQLAKWGATSEFIDDATLVLSELATNCVDACRGEVIGFGVYVADGALVIELSDSSVEPPVQRTAADDDVTGRGLDIVDFLADSWGMRWLPAGGKCVWARLVPG